MAILYPVHGSKYFDLREFVDERTFGILGEQAPLQIDPKIVRICDLVREKTGAPTYVNTWHFAKPGEQIYRSSGFRAVWDNTGGKLSQHRAGRAADVKVRGMTPAQVFSIIQAHRAEFLAAGLTRIENLEHTRSWIHMDCAPLISKIDDFLIVNP